VSLQFLPVPLTYWCFLMAIMSGLVRCPGTIRLAAFFLLLSLGTFFFGVTMFYSPYGVGLWLATSAAFAILALTLGVSAFVADFAKTRERASSVGRGGE
jgi:hypothetical protein